MALMNLATICAMYWRDALITTKACILMMDKKTYGEICIKLGVTENQARQACGKCE
jgi:hypothetical protein